MTYCGCFEEEFPHGDNKYNDIKEQLSVSYIRVIASYLGMEMTKCDRVLDNDGIDVTLRLPYGRIPNAHNPKPAMDIQLKCTTNPIFDSRAEHLNFDLKVDVFNKMYKPGVSPHLLMVLVLPEIVSEWVQDTDMLIMHGRMYWYNPQDHNRIPDADQEKIRLNIPIQNIVTKESLSNMFIRIAMMEVIKNA